SIENNLHWQLDVSFNEDNQRKKRNAAQNVSLINKLALTLLKQDTSKGSIKSKRKRAGWDNEFLAILLAMV
ncbi:MAG: transposase, partial [Paludibacteraceae bacterium]|nr:transposase [Paludibacteraceae bacterium]